MRPYRHWNERFMIRIPVPVSGTYRNIVVRFLISYLLARNDCTEEKINKIKIGV